MILNALTLKNENKDSITIQVRLEFAHYFTTKKDYFDIVDILIKPYKKRINISIKEILEKDSIYRSLSGEERLEYRYKFFLQYISLEQMQEALNNAWLLLKPRNLYIS